MSTMMTLSEHQPSSNLDFGFGAITVESEDWRKLLSPSDRKRVQNRLSQRKYRQNSKKAGNNPQNPREVPQTSTVKEHLEVDVAGFPIDLKIPEYDDALVFNHVAYTDTGTARNTSSGLDIDPVPSSFYSSLKQSLTEPLSTLEIMPSCGSPSSQYAPSSSSTSPSVNGVNNGNTPLHDAILHDRIAISTMLIERGADANAINASGQAPLHIAAARGADITVRLLLHRGCNIDAKCFSGMTALHVAVINGNSEVASTLLDHGAAINESRV